MPSNHIYNSYVTSSGATLYTLRTAASNIKLKNYTGNGNLNSHSDIGVNGGFSAAIR